MKTTESHINTIISSNLDAETTPPSLSVYGWQISQFPPAITAPESYAASPTSPIQVEASTAGAIPLSIVTPNDAPGDWEGDISWNSIPGCTRGDKDGVPYYLARGGAQYCINTVSPIKLNTSLIIDAASITNNGVVNTNWDVWINDQAYSLGSLPDNNPSWHKVVVPITVGMLEGTGGNLIKILPTNGGAWVRSIELNAGTVPTSASYIWTCIASGDATQNTPQSVTKSITEGTTNTDEEIHSFAETIGLTVNAKGVEEELAGISGSLSTSFTNSNTESHSVSINKSSTTSWTTKIKTTGTEKSVTYQIWQLSLVYESSGEIITVKVPLGVAPLVVNKFIQE
jgi:hypothetical protein